MSLADVPIVVVNLSAYASSLSKITSLTDLPVVQDEEALEIADEYGAYKWFIYIINADGSLNKMHYDLPMPNQLSRLVEWINSAKEGS